MDPVWPSVSCCFVYNLRKTDNVEQLITVLQTFRKVPDLD